VAEREMTFGATPNYDGPQEPPTTKVKKKRESKKLRKERLALQISELQNELESLRSNKEKKLL